MQFFTNGNGRPDSLGNLVGDTTISIAKTFNKVGPIDIVYTVVPTALSRVYTVEERQGGIPAVKNNTGITWFDFHHVIGFADFGSNKNFVPGDGFGAAFVGPNSVETKGITPVDEAKFKLTFPGENFAEVSQLDWIGNLPTGASVYFKFAIGVLNSGGVPDRSKDPANPGSYQFVLRQVPTVPEPGTAQLLGLSGLALLVLGWRAKRSGVS